jgi:hypothetical protein
MHLVELAVFARELSRAKRAPRVDDHVALSHNKAHLEGNRLQPAPNLLGASAPEVGLEWDSLDRRLGMELKGQPRQLNKAFLFQAFDSDRVDVAPRSNVVGEDDKIRALGKAHLTQPTGVA